MEQIMNQSPFCAISNLHVAFHGRTVLHNLSLTLAGHGIKVIIGPSGSGKTTLLRCLNRLNEHYPGYSGSGQINLRLDASSEDINHSAIDLTTLRRRVGMVFQTPNVLPTSIVRNILLPLKLVSHLDKNTQEEQMVKVLQEVQLWNDVKNRLKDDARHLSGGQQQRLCLARVLALEPRMLLLDEPTASLDFKTSQRIEELLLELQEQYQIIAVSHSLRQAKALAEQLIVMKEGKIEYQLNKDQFENRTELQTLFEQVF